MSWGHGLHINNYLAVHGHWECKLAPPYIEVEISLIEDVKGKWKTVEEAKKEWEWPGELGKTGEEKAQGWYCEGGAWYQAWVWGRDWDGFSKQTNWYATEEDGHEDQCPEGLGEDPTRGDESGSYES